MEIRNYTATADTIVRIVAARKALSNAFDTLSAMLGLPTQNETVVPGNIGSTKAALASARGDAQAAADLLHALAVLPTADLDPSMDAALRDVAAAQDDIATMLAVPKGGA